jgi:hypothetical protein
VESLPDPVFLLYLPSESLFWKLKTLLKIQNWKIIMSR